MSEETTPNVGELHEVMPNVGELHEVILRYPRELYEAALKAGYSEESARLERVKAKGEALAMLTHMRGADMLRQDIESLEETIREGTESLEKTLRHKDFTGL